MTAKKDEGNDLEVRQEGTIAPRISGGADEGRVPAGFDGIEEGDLRVARLAIAQSPSQVCIDGKAKMGDLFNTITAEVYGAEVEIIPLFMFKTRAQFDVERGLVMMSRDNIKVTMGKDEFERYIDQPVEEVPGADWVGKEPPTFCVVYNFPCLLAGQLNQFPLSLSLMRTAVKTAKIFLSMARYSGEDMFARVYKVSCTIEKSAKGTYALPKINFLRRCTDEEYGTAKRFFDALYRRKSSIDVELEDAGKEPE